VPNDDCPAIDGHFKCTSPFGDTVSPLGSIVLAAHPIEYGQVIPVATCETGLCIVFTPSATTSTPSDPLTTCVDGSCDTFTSPTMTDIIGGPIPTCVFGLCASVTPAITTSTPWSFHTAPPPDVMYADSTPSVTGFSKFWLPGEGPPILPRSYCTLLYNPDGTKNEVCDPSGLPDLNQPFAQPTNNPGSPRYTPQAAPTKYADKQIKATKWCIIEYDSQDNPYEVCDGTIVNPVKTSASTMAARDEICVIETGSDGPVTACFPSCSPVTGSDGIARRMCQRNVPVATAPGSRTSNVRRHRITEEDPHVPSEVCLLCDSEGIAKRGLNPRLRDRQEPTAGSLTPYGPFSSATTASPPIIATSTITPAPDFPDRRAMSSSIWSWQEIEVSWSQLTTVEPRMSGEGDTWSTTDTYLFHGTRTFNCGDLSLSRGRTTAPTPTTLHTVANRLTA
jgi:hypothetical protein